jgi:hypothetical protein
MSSGGGDELRLRTNRPPAADERPPAAVGTSSGGEPRSPGQEPMRCAAPREWWGRKDPADARSKGREGRRRRWVGPTATGGGWRRGTLTHRLFCSRERGRVSVFLFFGSVSTPINPFPGQAPSVAISCKLLKRNGQTRIPFRAVKEKAQEAPPLRAFPDVREGDVSYPATASKVHFAWLPIFWPGA